MASTHAVQPLLLEKAFLSSVISTVHFASKVHVFGCICVTVDGNEAGSVTIKLNKLLGQLDKKGVSNEKHIEESLNELRSSCRRRSKSFDGSLSHTDENENICAQKSAFKRSFFSSLSHRATSEPQAVNKVECSKVSEHSLPSFGALAAENNDPKQRQVLEKALKEFIKVKYQQKQSGTHSSPVSKDSAACSSPVPPEFLKLVALQARIMGVSMPDDAAVLSENSSYFSVSPLADDQLSALLKDIKAKTPHGISDLVLNNNSLKKKPALAKNSIPVSEILETSPEKGITKQKRLSFSGNDGNYQEEQGAFAKAMHKKLNLMKNPVVLNKAATSPRIKRKSLFRTGSGEKRRAFMKEMLDNSFAPPSRKRIGETESGSSSSISGQSIKSGCNSMPNDVIMGSPSKIAKYHVENGIRDRKPSLTQPDQFHQINPERDIFKDLLLSEVPVKGESHEICVQQEPITGKREQAAAISKQENNSNYTFKPIKSAPTNKQVNASQISNQTVIPSSQKTIKETHEGDESSKTKACDESQNKRDGNYGVNEVSQTGHSFLSQQSLESLTNSDLEYDSDCDTSVFLEKLPFSDIDKIPDMPVFVSKQQGNSSEKATMKECSSNEDSNSSVGSVGFEPTSEKVPVTSTKSKPIKESHNSQNGENAESSSLADEERLLSQKCEIKPTVEPDRTKGDVTSETTSNVACVMSRPKSRQRKSKPTKFHPKPDRKKSCGKSESKPHKSSCSACSEKRMKEGKRPSACATKDFKFKPSKNANTKSALSCRSNSDSSISSRSKPIHKSRNSDSSILKVLKSQTGAALKGIRSTDSPLKTKTNPVSKNTKSKSTPSLVSTKYKSHLGTSNLKSACDDMKVTSNRKSIVSTKVTKYDMSILKKIRPVPEYEIDVDFAENPYPTDVPKTVSSNIDVKKVSDKFILRGFKSQNSVNQTVANFSSTNSASTSSVLQNLSANKAKSRTALSENGTNSNLINSSPNHTDFSSSSSDLFRSISQGQIVNAVKCSSTLAESEPQPNIKLVISKSNSSKEMKVKTVYAPSEYDANKTDKSVIKSSGILNQSDAPTNIHETTDVVKSGLPGQKTVIDNPVKSATRNETELVKPRNVSLSVLSSDKKSKPSDPVPIKRNSLQNESETVGSRNTCVAVPNCATKTKASVATTSLSHLLVRPIPVASTGKVKASPKRHPEERHKCAPIRKSPLLVSDNNISVSKTPLTPLCNVNDSIPLTNLQRLQQFHAETPVSPCKLKLMDSAAESTRAEKNKTSQHVTPLRLTPINIPLEKEIPASKITENSIEAVSKSDSMTDANVKNTIKSVPIISNVSPSIDKENEQFVKYVLSPNGCSASSPPKTKSHKRRSTGSSKRKKRTRTNSKQSASDVWQVPTQYQRAHQGAGRCGKAKNGSQQADAAGFKMKKYWLDMYGPGSPMAQLHGNVK